MEISHPRRILAVSQPDSGLLDLLKELTGSNPSIPDAVVEGEEQADSSTGTTVSSSVAGSSHTLALKTAYYSASVPIWLDEVITPSAWAADFLAPEAKEVLAVLGAFVVCFRKPIDEAGMRGVKDLLEGIGKVVKDGCGYAWDGVCIAVAMPQSVAPKMEMSSEEWGDVCQDYGFEFVDFEEKGRNDYSELLGVARLKEALEANDWDGADDAEGGTDLDDFEAGDEAGGDEGSIGFGIDPAEMEEEMAGMKQAIYGGGAAGADDEIEDEETGDREIQQLQTMMLKMQAVKDMGADLPEAERKRLAAKTVKDIMKTLQP